MTLKPNNISSLHSVKMKIVNIIKDNESIMMMQLVVIVKLIYLFWKLLKIIRHPILNHLEMKRNQQSMANFSWILLWIMNFRIRFNISETATESLVKFMKLVLTEIGGNEFTNFPSNLYLAKKSLGFNDRFHSFVPCPKCHKLYNKD